MRTHLWWYVARAGGLTAWALLALSTMAGVATATRVLGRRVTPAWSLAVHRFLGGMAVTFVGIHVLGIVAVAWGVVAAWVLVAVEVTSLLRNRIPARAWRTIHLASYVLFVTSTLHLFSAGTDTYGLGIRLGVTILTGGVALLTIAALLEVLRRPELPHPPAVHAARPGSADWVDRPPTRPPYADLRG